MITKRFYKTLARYGVGSGNAPTPRFLGVGHLRRAFIFIPKIKNNDYRIKR